MDFPLPFYFFFWLFVIRNTSFQTASLMRHINDAGWLLVSLIYLMSDGVCQLTSQMRDINNGNKGLSVMVIFTSLMWFISVTAKICRH